MHSPGEAVERWREIERALAEGTPLPSEARRYLFDVAQQLTLLADDSRVPPEQAAKLVPEVIKLTGRAIRADRATRRAAGVRFMFNIEQKFRPEFKVETVADDLARRFRMSASTVFRLIRRAKR